MNILVLNGSPKGKNSITIQTVLYLEKRYPQHHFTILHVAQKIRLLEQDFTEALTALNHADLILFAYPVYTFLAPFQLHRFIELMKDNELNMGGKFASQISTSKHFYDVTAHKYIEENCYDLNLKYIPGLSADMDDLLTDKGQREADCFFQKMMFDIENNIYKEIPMISTPITPKHYKKTVTPIVKSGDKRVVVVTNVADNDYNLLNMIEDFISSCQYKCVVKNIRKFPFIGGCLGCLNCATTAQCIYTDGFEDYLRNEIQTADSIVYAFTIENHYTHSSFKCYDDRQFCNGHRSVTTGMPVGYIISGPYQSEYNIQTLVNARSEVGGVYLSGVATDEADTTTSILQLTKSLEYALTHPIEKPANFYAVGGSKIFRDLVYLMQGMMKADHKYYKEHGIYDFPQKKPGRIMMMHIIGFLMSIPSVQKKMRGKMSEYIIAPYTKLLDNTKPME